MGVTVALHQHSFNALLVVQKSHCNSLAKHCLNAFKINLSWMKNELGGRELGIAICFVSTSFLTLSEVWKSY